MSRVLEIHSKYVQFCLFQAHFLLFLLAVWRKFSCDKGGSIKCSAGGGIRTLPFRRGVTVPFPPSCPCMTTRQAAFFVNLKGGRGVSQISASGGRGAVFWTRQGGNKSCVSEGGERGEFRENPKKFPGAHQRQHFWLFYLKIVFFQTPSAAASWRKEQ